MIIIYDHRLPCEYVSALREQLPGCVLSSLDMSASSNVYQSISSHPDIYFFQADQHILIHAPGVPQNFLKTLTDHGVQLIKGADDPTVKYPQTAGYNAVRVGILVFHNTRYTDSSILERVEKLGLEAVHAEQGYTRCSVLPVGARGIMTADSGAALAAEKKGLDVLRISAGDISLPGEACGFIGGVCGLMPDGSVVVLGDLNFHPDVDRIKDFFAVHEINLIDMEGLPLYDAGSLIICG